MIRVTIEVRGRTVSRRMTIMAHSVERALELAGSGKPNKRVRVIFRDDEDVPALPKAA